MKTRLILRVLLFGSTLLLPFAVFYWTNPLVSGQSIGNDYQNYSIDQQMALQYSIERGSFPLYAPGFAGGGHSTAALTLGQLYHPLSHFASILPGYWDGNAIKVNTMIRLGSVGICHLILLILLLRFRLKVPTAFIISFITVYNLRTLDMFRYGASLENYLAFLMLCAFLAFYYLKPSRVLGPLSLIFSTYLLVCGGHPQIMYLGLLGTGLITVLIPFAIAAIFSDEKIDKSRVRSFYLRAGCFIACGIALSAAYILPFYFEFICQNAARVDRTYSFSLAYSDSWGGALNSFFRPLHSDVHGAFGGSAIIVLILLIPIFATVLKRVPKIIYVLFGVCLFIFLVSLGRATPLHYLVWKAVPLFDSFRTPGRINQILPFLFLLLLSWLLNEKTELSFRFANLNRISAKAVIAISAVLVHVIYNLFIIDIVPKPKHYIPAQINEHSFFIHQLSYWIGFVSLCLLVLYMLFSKKRIVSIIVGLLLVISVTLQSTVGLRWGTWIAEVRTKLTLTQMNARLESRPVVPGMAGFGMEAPQITNQMRESVLQPTLTRIYRTYRTVDSIDDAYKHTASRIRIDEAAVVSSANDKANSACEISKARCNDDTVKMSYSSYNRSVFEVNAAEDSLLVLSYPFFENWRAFVNGVPQKPAAAEGSLTGVFIPKGKSTVEFRFESLSSLVGFSIFVLVLLCMGLFFSTAFSSRLLKACCIVAGVLPGAGIFALQYTSLYVGDNLNTKYEWTSKEMPDVKNIALGRKTTMSSCTSWERPYDYYAGRAVDGDKKTYFQTDKKGTAPWWQIDFGQARKIDYIILHESLSFPLKAVFPVFIKTSLNGIVFKKSAEIDESKKAKPLRIEIKENTRFLRIESATKGTLSLREVEVFGISDN